MIILQEMCVLVDRLQSESFSEVAGKNGRFPS